MRGKNQQHRVTVINNIRDRDQQYEITGIEKHERTRISSKQTGIKIT
jgi:hypothetical protein